MPTYMQPTVKKKNFVVTVTDDDATVNAALLTIFEDPDFDYDVQDIKYHDGNATIVYYLIYKTDPLAL